MKTAHKNCELYEKVSRLHREVVGRLVCVLIFYRYLKGKLFQLTKLGITEHSKSTG